MKRRIIEKNDERINKRPKRETFHCVNNLGTSVINRIKPPTRLLITGRSTLGKTTLAVDIIMKQIIPHVRRCFAVSPTFYSQDALKPLRMIRGAFIKKHVFTEVNEEVFEHINDICTKYPAPTLLFIDDSAAEHATHGGNKGAFARLCNNSPHLKLTIVGCFQKIITVSPTFRYNCENFISFEPCGMRDVDQIIEEFNPCPSHPKSRLITRKALTEAWSNERFAYINKEAFSVHNPKPKVRFFSGFSRCIEFK